MTEDPPPRTHYDVLGIDRNVDDKAIRRAYMKASLKHHPDKNPGDADGAQRRFVEVGRAYEVLKDPALRAAYDRELDLGTWRRRKQGGGDEGSARGFESYSAAFEAFMARMSEEEVRAAVGAAAAVGSVIGSIVGSRVGRRRGGGGGGGGGGGSSTARGLIGVAGSIVGSEAGSRMAGELVRSVHERSVERVTYEERRRAAVERGEAVPEKPRSVLGGLRESIGRTAEAVAKSVNEGAPSTECGGSDRDRPNKLKSAIGTAVNVAGAFAATNEAKIGRNRR